MKRWKTDRSRSLARAIARDNRIHPNSFMVDSYSSLAILAENRRIARRIVKEGLLAGNESEFTYHAELDGESRFHMKKPHAPHFCNDCAHQGNHTPQQLGSQVQRY